MEEEPDVGETVVEYMALTEVGRFSMNFPASLSFMSVFSVKIMAEGIFCSRFLLESFHGVRGLQENCFRLDVCIHPGFGGT